MDKKATEKLKRTLDILIPDNNTDVRSLADLKDSPDPAVHELCEAAELLNHLSKREGS